eukprot:SM000003S11205  [mRNA]  locus=s3:1500774:1509493:- [translate_table: standard]
MGGDKRKTSDVFVKALENERIEYIFGIPGEENMDLLDSLQTSTIKLIVTRHEQAAGFMAATVGRLTGQCGVCLSTLGPGATNFTTAAAYAQLAGFPMMMITGQKPIRKSKQGSFQIVDIVENLRPITKYTRQIADGDLVPSLVREAARLSMEERPGAVHLELPEDIASTLTNAELFPVHQVRRPVAEEKAIAKAVAMIEAAQRPLLLIGAGANRKLTQKMLRQFVDKLGVPFVTTQMGKGVVPDSHPLCLGCCALSANDFPHLCCETADLIINIGHDVVEKPPFIMRHNEPPMVIHVNFYSAKVDNVYFPQLEVVGDIANAVWQLTNRLEPQSHWDHSFMMGVKKDFEDSLRKNVDNPAFPLSPQRVVADVRRALPDDGVACLDNGMYKIYFARCYKAYQPNTLLLDNALATMGAGLPSAMAVSLLYPEKKVVAVCGDGGFMMNSQELETAVRIKLNMTVIVINDNGYGMIKWKQHAAGFNKFGLELDNPDFVAYANSYGAKGFRVTKADEFLEILHQCLDVLPGVKLIEVPVDYTEDNEVLDKELPGLVRKDHVQANVLNGKLKEVAAVPAICGSTLTSVPARKDDEADINTGEKSADVPHPGGAPLLTDNTGPAKAEAPVKVSSAEFGMLQSASKEGASEHQSAAPPRAEASTSESEVTTYPFYIANVAKQPNTDLEVTNKYTGKVGARCALAHAADIEEAIAAAERAAPAMAAMASYERKAVCEMVVREVKARSEEFAKALCMEAGKPIRDSRGEVQRLIDTFQIAAEESVRMYGEYAPIDISERAKGYQSLVRRFPIGPISMVSPFNFPLNLAAHKIAPALAVGCPFVMKPASRTPIGALLLGEILSRANLPEGAFSILPCARDGADLFTTDDRFKLLSFTGSPSVGWAMKARAGKKKVVLELGGNAACIVDELVPDLGGVIARIVHGGFYQSGQSCISNLYETVKGALTEAVSQLKEGDPLEEETFIGPIIAESEAKRIEQWVDHAVENGARVLIGGKRDGVFYKATVMENVRPDMEVHCEEVFGPVVVLIPYDDFVTTINDVNASKFGLQAGVFTRDLNKTFYAFEHLDVGGVCINDVPSMRIDSQPYGGVKDSGLGREGLRYAMEDMTETRVMLMRNVGQIV